MEESGEDECMGEHHKVLIVNTLPWRSARLTEMLQSLERFREKEVQEQLKCAANGATENLLQRTFRHPAQHGQKCQTVKYTFSL